MAQGLGGGEDDGGGHEALGDQEPAFLLLSELKADSPRLTEVWAGRIQKAASESHAVTGQIFFRAPLGLGRALRRDT